MNKRQILLLLLIFGISGSLGYWYGVARAARSVHPIITPVVNSSMTKMPALENGQRSLYLVTVDKMQEKDAHLLNIWLLSYLPTSPTIVLLPIYTPGQAGKNNSMEDQRYEKAFGLQREGKTYHLNPALISLLAEENYDSLGYIVLDTEGWSQMLMIFSKNSASLVDHIVKGKNGKGPSQGDQAVLIQEVCRGFPTMSMAANAKSLGAIVPDHASSSLPGWTVLADFTKLVVENGHINCDFPTLFAQQSK